MKKYGIFFDIDGTILNTIQGKAKPSKKLIEALTQLHQQGHLCYIASGRPYSQLSEEIKNLPFDGFILCNGAMALEKGQVVLSFPFDKQSLKEIVMNFEKMNSPYTLVSYKDSFILKKYEKHFSYLRLLNIPVSAPVDEIDLDKIEVVKIETSGTKRKAAQYIEKLEEKGYVVHSYKMFSTYEINMPNVSKGNAIKEILKLHQIPLENSIAFGDGENDIEMLKAVKIGVAMENASNRVKEAANRVTESCANDGVVRELQRMGLVKEIIK